MRPFLGIAVVVLSVIPLAAADLPGRADSNLNESPAASNITELERAIGQILTRTRTPGASVALVRREGVIWAAGIGTANLADASAANSETLFRIGSITKSFVALSVMMLVEEGKLSLDDRLRELVPELSFENPWESTDPVRLVHLLEHTAGWDMHSLLEAAYDNPAPISLRSALALRPATRTSRWKPGTGFSYSNVGAPVTALVVEKVTGRRFEDFVEERIFKPIGMRSATFFADSGTPPQLAAGYDPHLKRVRYSNLLYRPAGAVSASAQDMAALVRLYLNRGSAGGVQLIRPDTVDRIERPESSLAARSGIRTGYGLFNHTKEHRGYIFHGHTGGVDGYCGEMFYLPEAGLGYSFTINVSSGAAFYQIGQELRQFVTKGLPRPALPPPSPVEAVQISGWTGYYEPQNPPIEYFRLMNRLMGTRHVGLNRLDLVIEPLLGGTERKIVFCAEGQFRPADSLLANTLFTRDEDGARVMVADQGSIFRELPGWRAWGRTVLAVACPILIFSPAISGLWWIWLCLRGKHPRTPRPAVWTYLWLFAAAISLAGMLALNSVTGDTVWRLAYRTPYSIALFLLSLLFPASSLLGLIAAVCAVRKGIRWSLALHLLACSLAACAVSVYLGLDGYLGVRTWHL